jgi:hypothetical protein
LNALENWSQYSEIKGNLILTRYKEKCLFPYEIDFARIEEERTLHSLLINTGSHIGDNKRTPLVEITSEDKIFRKGMKPPQCDFEVSDTLIEELGGYEGRSFEFGWKDIIWLIENSTRNPSGYIHTVPGPEAERLIADMDFFKENE